VSKKKQGKQAKLTDEQIAAIADRVEARLQEQPAAAPNGTTAAKPSGRTGIYFLGASVWLGVGHDGARAPARNARRGQRWNPSRPVR